MFGVEQYIVEPSYYRGLTGIHEIGGHAYLRIYKPLLSQGKHNEEVEKFEDIIRKFYLYNGTPIKGFAEPH